MLTHELNCILLLDYKVTLSKYDINNKRFLELEVCAWGIKLYEFIPELLVNFITSDSFWHNLLT